MLRWKQVVTSFQECVSMNARKLTAETRLVKAHVPMNWIELLLLVLNAITSSFGLASGAGREGGSQPASNNDFIVLAVSSSS